MGNISESAGHLHLRANATKTINDDNDSPKLSYGNKTEKMAPPPLKGAAFTNLSLGDVFSIARRHPLPCVLTFCLLFFMGVEYTIRMVPFDSPPVDIGFVFTRGLNGFIADRPVLNSVLAAGNTVFVLMQTAYILWTLLVEGRARPTVAALFMFTCRGVLGCLTQLPLPQDFLGSGMDFPVGNVSFFLFFSGHVAGAVIGSLDMRRMRRWRMAQVFDALNVLQVVRLLGTRGHYTIDLAVGIGAGMLFDLLAGGYERNKSSHLGEKQQQQEQPACCSCTCCR